VGVGSYSLDIEIFAYITTLDGDEFMRIRQDLLLQILDAVETAGAALALPTQASVAYDRQSTLPPPSSSAKHESRGLSAPGS
jgi:MscS family membrane protein